MGLLSRVALNDSGTGPVRQGSAFDLPKVLDEMGEALADRIMRLPPSPSRSESALNLLKPYIGFKAAFCAAGEGDRYVAYAAAGISAGKAEFDKKDVVLSGEGLEKLDIPASPYRIWAFALENSGVLFLYEDPANPFTVPSAGSLLAKIKAALLPFTGRAEKAAGNPGVEDFISAYYRDKGPFRGLVLAGDTGLLPTLAETLAPARITGLAPGVCLVLYPKPLNEKLMIHRLTESFGVKVLSGFEASGIAEALGHIENYRKA
ncbi:MAG: hypothetical protein LBK40_06355 [Spirochaetaceae bacterium]|jgi:hypothetical protein|nr:hypothetical protein [Spirochaetaceae bacterium]